MEFRINYSKYENEHREGLAELYKDLGWNPDTHSLNPKEIKVSQNTWHKLMDTLFPERTVEQGFFYMNYGPSVEDSMKDDYIRFGPECLVEEETTQKEAII